MDSSRKTFYLVVSRDKLHPQMGMGYTYMIGENGGGKYITAVIMVLVVWYHTWYYVQRTGTSRYPGTSTVIEDNAKF